MLLKQPIVILLVTTIVSIIISIGHVQSQVVSQPFLGVTTIVSGNSYGDGLPPQAITLNTPLNVKVAPNGEVLICDTFHFTIRKVMSTNGKVSTIAGRAGVSSDSGEGGLAINSILNLPSCLDFTQQGEILLADNKKIKKIDKNGIITTIAGTGSNKFSFNISDGSIANETAIPSVVSVAVHPMSGEIYFTDAYSNVVRKISHDGKLYLVAGVPSDKGTYSGDGDLAINARFYFPLSLVFNSIGELFVADSYNHRIRKIFTNGTITTIAGSDQSGYGGENVLANQAVLSYPVGLAIKSDELYFVDSGNAIVRKISINGILSTVAGTPSKFGFSGDGGLATSAQLNFDDSDSIAFSSDGTMYFTESGNNRIRIISLDGIIDTFAGGGLGDGFDPAKYGVLELPVDVSLTKGGDLLIVDQLNKLVRKLSNNGNSLSTIAGSLTSTNTADGELATKSKLKYPVSAIEGPDGNIYISDRDKIRLINVTDLTMTTFAGTGSVDFTPDGTPVNSSSVGYAYSLIFNSLGEIIFSDQFNNRIRKLSKDGTIQTIAGIGIGQDSGKYSGDGGLAKETDINYPHSLVLTMNGDLIFVDKENYRIRKIFENGTIITIAGNGVMGYSGDGGLAVEASINPGGGLALSLSGDLYFTDNNAIRKIYSNGTITTISGGLNSGLSGDGGLAINATFNKPIGIAIDSNDNLYIADTSNKRVRKISLMCESPYVVSGSACVPACFGVKSSDSSTVCSGHGSCNQPNNCSCNSPYYGDNCELFTCNGIENNSTLVCSSHGICKDYNSCSCLNGYYGNNCQSFNCSGIDSNSNQVCSGNGKCSTPNNCTCQTGYYGNNCENYDCYAISKNSPTVCSTFGICTAPNQCNCSSPGYSGSTCNVFSCNGILSNSSLVCSSHGSCISSNNCSCQTGYYGSNCESFNCNGIKNSNPSVCSSRGQCTAPEICKCSANSFGTYCEKVITASSSIGNVNGTIPVGSRSVRLNHGVSNRLPFVLISLLILILIFYY